MRKILYIFYIPFLILEWFIDMIVSLISVIHTSIKELTLAIENFIHEHPINPPADQSSA